MKISRAHGWGINGGKCSPAATSAATVDTAPSNPSASPTPNPTPPAPARGAADNSVTGKNQRGMFGSVRNDAKILAAQVTDGITSGTWLVGLCIILGAATIAVAIMVLAQAVSMR